MIVEDSDMDSDQDTQDNLRFHARLTREADEQDREIWTEDEKKMAIKALEDLEEKEMEPEEAVDKNWKEIDSTFRFHARKAFLTYPQVGNLSHEEVFEALQEKWPMDVKGAIITKEKHFDGGMHFHVLLYFNRKMKLRGARCFDIWWDLHPNIQTPKNETAVLAYISKTQADGKPPFKISFGNTKEDMSFVNSNGFLKKRAESLAYKHHLKAENKPSCHGKELKIGGLSFTFNLDPAVKKRNLWIWGSPDQYKTHQVDEQVHIYKVYCRGPKPYPYDVFDNEEIIWNDDHEDLNQAEICHMTNTTKVPRQVFGATRNVVRRMPEGKPLIYLCTTNYEPPWVTEDWFKSRFHVWYVDEHGVWTDKTL